MTSHAWSTSLRVGGTSTATRAPSLEGIAKSAMRESRSATWPAARSTPTHALMYPTPTSMRRAARSGYTAMFAARAGPILAAADGCSGQCKCIAYAAGLG